MSDIELSNKIKIHFLGASGTVTGSKFLIETPERNVMVDCGMFQGLKSLRSMNWDSLPFDAFAIDDVLLTHGHLDHCGYLPRLYKQGFRGTIHGTAPTLSIAQVILFDSARIHEDEAQKANKEGYSKHHPALPFYTVEEAEETIKYFDRKPLDTWLPLSDNIQFRFRYNGHIIGSTFIEMDVYGKRFVFSGDVGRVDDILLMDPEKPEKADYLFMESTYGNRIHPDSDVESKLTELVNRAISTGGTLIIPSFAVERMQMLMFILWEMYAQEKLPTIPIYVDSPMGANVLSVFKKYPNWHKVPEGEFDKMQGLITLVSSYKETWEVIDNKVAKIVIAGSGMVTGGRVLTYLQQLIDEPSTAVLLVGFQAEGTRGRQLLEGAHELKFYGKYYPVNAHIDSIESLSAHADQSELLDWLSEIKEAPEQVFLVHGESTPLDVMRVKLQTEKGWNVKVPMLGEVVEVSV